MVSSAFMNRAAPLLLLFLAACRDQRPPVPNAEEAEQLNEVEDLLNDAGNEKGPEEQAPGPSRSN
jgi:hypothetical protein